MNDKPHKGGTNVWNDRKTKDRHRGLAREMFWEANDSDEYQCPDCDRRRGDLLRPFEIHHENGNPMDNSNENLVGLCRPCHNIREGKKPSVEEIQNLRDAAKDARSGDEDTAEGGAGGIITQQFGQPTLKCPECGDAWLHQERVEVFVRGGEDANEGTHVTVDYRDGVSRDRSMGGNPSGRRDGIRIAFECELCGMQPRTLRIVQHKGNEFVSWEESA